MQINPIALVHGKIGHENGMSTTSPVRPLLPCRGDRAGIRHGDVLPALPDQAMPLEAMITSLSARGGAGLLERLFAPSGYRVDVTPIPFDPADPNWSDSPYATMQFSGTVRLIATLAHLFVLINILNNPKHYQVGED